MPANVIARAARFGRMIKFSHSVFALPFAFVSAIVATRQEHIVLTLVDGALLIVCMVSARTAAMGFNRIVDRKIDAANPRTKNRELPAGSVSLRDAHLFTWVAAATFVSASFGVNSLCGILSLPVLGLLLGYSLTKRFTILAHVVLGLCLGAAPVGVWFALTGTFSWAPIVLCLAVTMWTSGFDIYYSCQDEQFDRSRGLRSLPALVGVDRAIRFVRILHALAAGLYVLFGVVASMGRPFYVGAFGVATILAYEAWILRNGDLSRINLAFFNLNGYVSLLFALATVIDIYVA